MALLENDKRTKKKKKKFEDQVDKEVKKIAGEGSFDFFMKNKDIDRRIRKTKD